jgi:hypothetical protein
MAEAERPPLSVVIPVRGPLEEIAQVIEAVAPGAREIGAEVVVVGSVDGAEPPADSVRLVPVDSDDLLELHRIGIDEARGEVIAIGEDHAVPLPGWCETVVRAHSEHPRAAAVVGCLVNATDSTVAGRANFLAFAAPWQPPMPTLPEERPPPASALTFKRNALGGIAAHGAGWLEGELIPSLFDRGQMVADGRIVVEHFQDHGSLWSILNAFHSARSSYGAAQEAQPLARRLEVARWAFREIPRRQRREAREGSVGKGTGVAESALIALIACAAGAGAVAGSLLGPGRSPDRLA